MSKRKVTTEQIRAYIKASGNPYASLSIYDEYDKHDQHEQTHRYLKKSGNPYASLALNDEQRGSGQCATEERVQPVRHPQLGKMSKKDFQAQCRRIFIQYIPSEERRVLRPHHRDFIARNEQRPAEERYLLMGQLNKYDLSSSGNYRVQFNRERDVLTIEKLKKIEKKIDSE